MSEYMNNPRKNDVVLVTIGDESFDSGRTWKTCKQVLYVGDPDKIFIGTERANGPSYSEGNRIISGHSLSYCRRWTGSKWAAIDTDKMLKITQKHILAQISLAR